MEGRVTYAFSCSSISQTLINVIANKIKIQKTKIIKDIRKREKGNPARAKREREEIYFEFLNKYFASLSLFSFFHCIWSLLHIHISYVVVQPVNNNIIGVPISSNNQYN